MPRIPTCRKVLTLRDAKKLSFGEAVRVAMEHTQKTGNEVAFRYDRSTKKPISHIIEGYSACMGDEPPTNRPIDRTVGDFHTHPTIRHGKCMFSMQDVQANFLLGQLGEMTVGCPTDGKVVRLEYPEPHAVTDLIADLARAYDREDLAFSTKVNIDNLSFDDTAATAHYLRKAGLPFKGVNRNQFAEAHPKLAKQFEKHRETAHNLMDKGWLRNLWDEQGGEIRKFRERMATVVEEIDPDAY